jgi:acyl carrier protein
MVIEDRTSSNDIEEWDSLNHINLVSAIEKEFQIKFALLELIELKDVGAMINLMVEKLK